MTGASGGIGLEVARTLHAGGARVVLAARDAKKLEALRSELGGHTLAIPTDVAVREDVSQLVRRTVDELGRVDILVNNAGIGLSGIVADLSLDDLERVFAVNVFGVVACVQAVIPHMRRQRFGHIVNISSILGKRAVPQTAGYAASKFALQALSDGLRIEEAPHGIAVTVVCPGSTQTDFRSNELRSGTTLLEERPQINLMTAARVAEITVDAIRKRRREVLLTPFAKLLSTLEKVSPRAVDLALRRVYHK